MGWIKWKDKTLEFVGKLSQTDSFEKWAESQGKDVIENLGSQEGGYVLGLGKTEKAKNLIWDDLASLATRPELKASVEAFVVQYPQLLGSLASKVTALPHIDSELCVVPRFLVNRDASVEVRKRLANSDELARLKGGASFREYFFEELVAQVDGTYAEAAERASPNGPLEVDDRWVVGFSPNYEWKGGSGSYYVYYDDQQTGENAKRAAKKEGKKEAAAMLARCQKWLGELSPTEREKLEEQFP